MPSERIRITWEGRTWTKEVHYCEVCRFKGAAFGIKKRDRHHWYCGWRDGEPVCVKGGSDGDAR